MSLVSPNDRREWSNSFRASVITLHGLCGWSFAKIERETGGLIPPTSASTIWRHTVSSAQISLQISTIPSWDVLLEHIEPSKRSGRPKALNLTLKSNLR